MLLYYNKTVQLFNKNIKPEISYQVNFSSEGRRVDHDPYVYWCLY